MSNATTNNSLSKPKWLIRQPPTFKNVGICSPNPLRIDAPGQVYPASNAVAVPGRTTVSVWGLTGVDMYRLALWCAPTNRTADADKTFSLTYLAACRYRQRELKHSCPLQNHSVSQTIISLIHCRQPQRYTHCASVIEPAFYLTAAVTG